jgi:hypothetical protein
MLPVRSGACEFSPTIPCWMRIFDRVKCRFAITDHSSEHNPEFMNQFASEPYRSFVIRILEKQLFILIFVLRQKPHSYVWSCSFAPQFRLRGRPDHAREMLC